jgi:archaellum biogenesis protein FlaJ (TadC family)
MGPIEAAVGILMLMALVVHIAELVGVSLSFMSVNDQETWEHDRVTSRGYERRRKQLIIHLVATTIVMTALLATAYKCWKLYTMPVNYDLAVIPEDPSDGLVVAAIGCLILVFAGLVRLFVLRAKLKAIRIIADKQH